ncbi:zinc metallopeptidase [Lachnotalea glycerini]|uniref:Peptidase n=1 Tax=Lachnotalea glycerini TaxID=1763509 RepID=A0A371JHU8_9FIRM|nr:zinc metallopeptidase [Lachnotalea glycerini]RDY32312.1 peptidase [Lachnotalea glycerini]
MLGYGYGFYYDPTYILVIIGIILTLVASAKVKGTFAKYSKVRSMSGMTGADAARRVLNSAGIYDVTIERISGNLTDHYDPRGKVLRLSDSVYGSQSVAAIGVAAHECGHAIQDQQDYVPLRIRASLVPVANIGSTLAWPIIVIGAIIGAFDTLVLFGIILFSAAVLFQLITLPVEFNASSRAVAILDQTGILGSQEIHDTKKVLSAAALTYVASAATAILQLLRLVLLFGGRDRD